MADSGPLIAPVTEENSHIHVERHRRHKKRNARRKAVDRRKSFECGELSGFLYCIGLFSIAVAASGQPVDYPLPVWIREVIACIGVCALVGKSYAKRRFWKYTEDAEHKEP